MYNDKIVLFKRSSNALMWLSNEVVETKGQSFRHYSREKMIKMQKYLTLVNPNSGNRIQVKSERQKDELGSDQRIVL